MNIVNKLTLRHLKENKSRTIITILAIILSVAMVCAVAGFVLSLRDVMLRTVIESRGDYHIVYFNVAAEDAVNIANEEIFSTSFTKTGEGDLQSVYLRLENPDHNFKMSAQEIADKYNIAKWDSNNEQLALEGFIAQDNVMRTFIIIAAIAIVIVVTGSVIVIANAFYISSSERVRQFGLLKSIGATKAQIGQSIFFEAFILAVIGIPLGIAFGFAIQAIVLMLTNNLLKDLVALNMESLRFKAVYNPVIIYISVAIAAVTLLISAWLPARRAANVSAIDAIRQTREIRIRPKQLKTWPIVQKIFGFEGTLASKSLKRSRGKYRATVISLTVSVVLFVSMSSLVWILNKDVEMQYGGYNFDVLLHTTGDLNEADDINDFLNTIPDGAVQKLTEVHYETKADSSFFTENADNICMDSDIYALFIYSITDEEFNRLVPNSDSEASGVLINTTGVFARDGRLEEHMAYNAKIGDILPLFDSNADGERVEIGSITIDAILPKLPESFPSPLFTGRFINFLVSESSLKDIYHPENSATSYIVTTRDPDGFLEAAEPILSAYEDSLSAMNVSQMTRLNRNMVLVVSLFGYGFITMLALIAITSVISTISTNMALRKQELAMLFSVGMTAQGMDKMLNLESLLYGVKSLFIGLPIGIGLSYLLYKTMSDVMVFAYELPLGAIFISILAVMFLTFGTMRYSRQKLNKISIVEALKSEVI
ncbi:ABC transporter permease [Tyzzerella sp. OttesenSCG-928-J15]|nr:ABC transporter permease [Tyzzerella sp. OttesenSCG-928-J15]